MAVMWFVHHPWCPVGGQLGAKTQFTRAGSSSEAAPAQRAVLSCIYDIVCLEGCLKMVSSLSGGWQIPAGEESGCCEAGKTATLEEYPPTDGDPTLI